MSSATQGRGTPLVRFAIDHPITMGMITLGVLVLGWISLSRLPLEFLPAFSSSSVTVNASYRSSSPEEVERLIARPLEESLATINNIDTLSSSATASGARVRINFVDGTDMEMAAVDVRDRVDRVRHLLPEDVDQIRISRFQSSDIPVLRFDLSARWTQEALYDFAERIVQRRLERLEGVAQVSVNGLRVPQIQINLDPARMQAHRVDVRQLLTLLRGSNVNLSAGEVLDGSRKLLVRAVGEFRSPSEIGELVLNDDGLRLADVGDVTYDFPQQENFNFLNGVESLTVRVNKNSNDNLLEVVNRLKAELEEIVKLPEAEGLTYRIYSDASLDVRKGLGTLRDAGLIGGLLAILAVYLFLRRFRTTMLVAIAIPVSVIGTFVLMYFLREAQWTDITLNVISLAGLMLALGMLVDNSIVVIESVFRHRNELNEDSRTAALMGTSEVALPIVAATLTTMCVFLPMIFMSGGRRFKMYLENIGLTVCIVMVASLIVALTVVPVVASRVLQRQAPREEKGIRRLTHFYGSTLRFTLRHRPLFVLLIVGLLYGSIQLFGTIERSFSMGALEREVIIKVDTPRQYSPEQIEALYKQVYALLDENREALDVSDIAYAYDRSTGRSRASWSRTRQFNLYLKDESESDLTTSEVQDRVRALLPEIAGVQLRIATGRGRSGFTGIQVQLLGDDPVVLELLGEQVAARLAGIPGVRDVDTSLESGAEEIRVEVQRERILQAGLSSQAVAATVNNALNSRAVSNFKTGEREVDIVMQYGEEHRETLDQLKSMAVFSGSTPLPLGALADFTVGTGPRSIERENHRAKLEVSANTAGGPAAFMAMRQVTQELGAMDLPAGYEWNLGRWNRIQRQDEQSGLFALWFALPLVYMVLAVLFESFTQPFTIMFSVPFALVGVAGAMKLAGQPWDNTTMLGMIILLGIVVNNAIVLINHINHLRAQGLARDEAIVLGGRHRLRPILITAITTILGMLPMIASYLLPQVFGPLEGRAATWAPMGLVIIGGLTTSTFLTLLVIPTIYSLLDDAGRFLRRVGDAA